jgi:hypothetical protein
MTLMEVGSPAELDDALDELLHGKRKGQADKYGVCPRTVRRVVSYLLLETGPTGMG